MPARCQRRNRPYTVCQGPYAGGTSRHGVPVRTRHRMPSMSWRLDHRGGRPVRGPIGLGSNGSSNAHCVSVRSARAEGMVSTRSPAFGISWSKHRLPETSLCRDHRHAHQLKTSGQALGPLLKQALRAVEVDDTVRVPTAGGTAVAMSGHDH